MQWNVIDIKILSLKDPGTPQVDSLSFKTSARWSTEWACWTMAAKNFLRPCLKGYLSSLWILNQQSVMVSSIIYVFMGFVVRDWPCADEFTNNGGEPTGALTTIGRLIIFLILLKISWKVPLHIRMTPVKSFLYQTTHSKVMICCHSTCTGENSACITGLLRRIHV